MKYGFAYSKANKTVSADIQERVERLAMHEEECEREMPMVMREYLAAEEEDRVMFEQTFQTFKANTVLRAREEWYEWKTARLNDGIRPELEAILAGMKDVRPVITK